MWRCAQVGQVFLPDEHYLSQFPVGAKSAANACLDGDIGFVIGQVPAEVESGMHHANAGDEYVDFTMSGR